MIEVKNISIISSKNYGGIKIFYRSVDYDRKVSNTCRFVTALFGENIVGVVRVCSEKGVLVLRGMERAEEFQRKGIGSEMLREVNTIVGDRIYYALAYSPLENFYNRAGFLKIDEAAAPVLLRNRLQQYKLRYPDREFIFIKHGK